MLHYQPKVNMRQGSVIGAEALIRWQHPEQGLLLPDSFLPILENHTLMIALGDWVIETALAQITAWRMAGVMLPVSINIVAMQLDQADFIDKLRAALARYPIVQPGDLELEVLETSALQDIARISQILRSGQALGIRFSLDDFGTGYSSLTYLKRLPVEILKIDQSFVRNMLDDPDDLAILDGVISLASSFQRQVIAEGVETTAHGELLLQLGCEMGQGYAIARPMPAAQIPGWITQWQPYASWAVAIRVDSNALSSLFAMIGHRAWIRVLYGYLNDEQASSPPLDIHQCPLGRWLDSQVREGKINFSVHTYIMALHDVLHEKAAELIDLKLCGEGALALARFGEIETLRETLLDRLRRYIG